MIRLGIFFLFASLATQTTFAQILPQGANVYLYFPQVADGGGEWQTTFTFVNPDDSVPAPVNLLFFKDDGTGLPVDLGSGSASSHGFTIPPRGTRILQTSGNSPTVVAGWALALSGIPIQGTAAYRQSKEGVPKLEVSVYPTLPTLQFTSPASRLHGYAIANTHTSAPITVELQIRNSEGLSLANPAQIEIPALGYRAGYVSQLFPSVGDFNGTLNIRAADTAFPRNNEFVAMTLSSDQTGIWSGLPSGAFSRPQPDYYRIRLVYTNVLNAARKNNLLTSSPDLLIPTGNEINARVSSDGNKIEISLGLAQLLDSDSELASVVGHELGHVAQTIDGLRYDSERELDADIRGMILAQMAGYDPYGAAGSLGKLGMVFGRADLWSQTFDDIGAPHTSFENRLDNLDKFLETVCDEYPDGCSTYKRMFHPNFPFGLPMAPKEP